MTPPHFHTPLNIIRCSNILRNIIFNNNIYIALLLLYYYYCYILSYRYLYIFIRNIMKEHSGIYYVDLN